MAHIQSKPVHDSEAQHKKNLQAVNAKNAASHRSPQKEATHVDNVAVQSIEDRIRVENKVWFGDIVGERRRSTSHEPTEKRLT